METLKKIDFGPEKIHLKNSIVFARFLSEHKRSIMKEKAETICKAIVQLQSVDKKPFILDRIRGSTFDFWNLYYNDKNVFCVSETRYGYTLRFFDDSDLDSWFDDLCKLALRHSVEYGRKL